VTLRSGPLKHVNSYCKVVYYFHSVVTILCKILLTRVSAVTLPTRLNIRKVVVLGGAGHHIDTLEPSVITMQRKVNCIQYHQEGL